MSDEEEVEPGRFNCPTCEARFDSVGDKKRHMRKQNCRPKPPRR